jgi:hypothetical protein
MSPIVKFTYYLSLAFLLASLFYSYYQFPEFVAVGFSDNVGLKEYRGKAELFYTGAAIFLVFNLLVVVMKKVAEAVPYGGFPMPAKSFWLQSEDTREALVRIHITWINSFATIFNLLIGYIFISLYIVNVLEFGTFHTYIPVIYVAMGLLSIWWLILLIRLLSKKIAL